MIHNCDRFVNYLVTLKVIHVLKVTIERVKSHNKNAVSMRLTAFLVSLKYLKYLKYHLSMGFALNP